MVLPITNRFANALIFGRASILWKRNHPDCAPVNRVFVKLNCAAEHNPSQRLTASSFKLLSSQPVSILNWAVN